MFKLDLEKANDTIAKISWIMPKGREFQKNIYFSFIDYAKAFDCMLLLLSCFSHVRLYATP